jgi:hypothetical protein
MPPIPILLSAGEASGDMHAAGLAQALQSRLNVQIFGMGGPQMQSAGVDLVTRYDEISVVGITEILMHLPSLLQAMDRIVAEAERRKPALAVLTDFPGFPACNRGMSFECAAATTNWTAILAWMRAQAACKTGRWWASSALRLPGSTVTTGRPGKRE